MVPAEVEDTVNEMNARVNGLESIVEQIGEAVLATTQTIENLGNRIENLSVQVEEQGKQIQQQGYQILALCNVIETLADTQDDSLKKITGLTQSLNRLMDILEGSEK